MLACRACLRRTIASSSLRCPSLYVALHSAEPLPPLQARRQFATAVAPVEESDGIPEETTLTLAAEKQAQKIDWAVRQHLKTVTDPYKIAELVEKILKKDRYDEALALARKASKDKQVVVSWNHLINYLMEKRKLHAAIKLFNEMKKRAQFPNVRTFTLIFKGCASSEHPRLAVSEAVRLYNNLLNDKRLQPNTIHMNAVIQVCARAGDIESMLTIAGTADDRVRAPSAWTYTALLNGLRSEIEPPRTARIDDEDTTPSVDPKDIQRVVQRSKALWDEAIGRWRNGKIVLDEEMVCAMGRTLLLDRESNQFEILALLEQTMSIPRLDGLPSPASSKTQDRLPKEALSSDMKNIAISGPAKLVPSTSSVYAVPGRNTLSLVLAMAGNTRHIKLGLLYWNLFVSHYGVLPDADNWHKALRLLRLGKSGANAADLLAIMPDAFMKPATFRIAMSTCLRDNMNPTTMANADRILDIMDSVMAIPDPHALRTYLRVALASHHPFRQQAKEGDTSGAKHAYGRQIVAALDKMEIPYRKCINTLAYPDPREAADGKGKAYNDRREAVALARKMVGAYDKLVTEQMVDERELSRLKTKRNLLNRYITRFFEKREQMEPRLPSAVARAKGGHGPRTPEEREEQESWDTTASPARAASKRW